MRNLRNSVPYLSNLWWPTTKVSVQQRAFSAFLCLVFFFSLAYIYVQFVSPLYGYEGLVSRDLSLGTWVLLCIMAISPAFTMDLNFSRPSTAATWFMYLSLIVPCSFIPEMTMGDNQSGALFTTTTIVLNFHIFEYVRTRKLIRLRPIVGFDRLLSVWFPILVLIGSVLLLAWNGMKIDLDVGATMYQRRLAARDTMAGGTLVAYLFSSFTAIAVPFTTGEAIATRKILPSLAAASSVIAVVSIAAERSVLFLPALCGMLVWIATRKRNRWLYIVGAFTLLCFVVGISGIEFFEGLLLERLISLPADLSGDYFHFASTTPPVFFRDMGLLSWIGISNPLGADLPRVIGRIYLHSDTVNANGNIWASAAVEIPYLGPILASVVAGTFLRLFDSIVATKASKEANVVAISVVSAWALVWSNSAIQTSLITNGVIGGTLLMLLIPRGDQAPQRQAVARSGRWSMPFPPGAVRIPAHPYRVGPPRYGNQIRPQSSFRPGTYPNESEIAP